MKVLGWMNLLFSFLSMLSVTIYWAKLGKNEQKVPMIVVSIMIGFWFLLALLTISE